MRSTSVASSRDFVLWQMLVDDRPCVSRTANTRYARPISNGNIQSLKSAARVTRCCVTPRQPAMTRKFTLRSSGWTLVFAPPSKVVVRCSLRSTISTTVPEKMTRASRRTSVESGFSRRQSSQSGLAELRARTKPRRARSRRVSVASLCSPVRPPVTGSLVSGQRARGSTRVIVFPC
jgi:hypothetical protein